jgi:excisionase family DNA binding protein
MQDDYTNDKAAAAPVMTVDEAAKILRLGRVQAYRAVARGEIPHINIGRRILVLREPLERMLRGEDAALKLGRPLKIPAAA